MTAGKITTIHRITVPDSTDLFLLIVLIVFILRKKLPHVIILGSTAFPGKDISSVIEGKSHGLTAGATLE